MMKNFIKNIVDFPSYKSNNRFVTIIVDDYGSIRMPSISVKKDLESKGFDFTNCRYSSFDSLETNEDLELLFEILLSIKSPKDGKNPVITPATCIANPDFTSIKKNSFEAYVYELFTKTFEQYGESSRVFDLYKKGIELNIFVPELHNREHLNVSRWMSEVKRNKLVEEAFNHKMFSVGVKYHKNITKDFQPAVDVDNLNKIEDYKLIITDGTNQFKSLFGYTPTLYSAPNGLMPKELFSSVAESGIKLIDLARFNKYSKGNGNYMTKIHYLNQKLDYDLKAFVRNCVFEPNDVQFKDPINNALKMIENSFQKGMPAIISSHRVNFTGRLSSQNRQSGLKSLSDLLKQIIIKWPDVEFLSVKELYLKMNTK